MLNDLAWDLVQQLMLGEEDLRVDIHNFDTGGSVIDCGVETIGSLSAGLALAEICTAGLADISIHPGTIGEIGWPHVFVQSDNPVEACLLSQYAGWSIQVKEFFGMGSGPMRARAGKEELFKELEFDDSDSDFVVGILETGDLPGSDVVNYVAETCKIDPGQVCLLAAPTSSFAGNLQVVARSLETAMHKLHVLGFDINRVAAGCGSAPLSPVAADDLTGIGRTNDAILYGGRVTLWIDGDDESVAEIGPKIPSSGSSMYGRPFLEVFHAAGGDFYKIDPLLFSPAEVLIHNIETGNVHHFGGLNANVLKASFGVK
jgi:methenyltetrahydromethanopterin cyclohydrolase